MSRLSGRIALITGASRDIDFRHVPGNKLNRRQVEAIGARYNRGPDLSLDEIEQNLDYGRDITKRWALLNRLIR